jgi:hypothetical protein
LTHGEVIGRGNTRDSCTTDDDVGGLSHAGKLRCGALASQVRRRRGAEKRAARLVPLG